MSCVYRARPVTRCAPSMRRRECAISTNSVPVGGTGRLAQQRADRPDLARRAEAALERIGIDERALYRMKLAILGKTLDCLDALSLARDRQRHAGIDRATVHQHGACAARSLVTDLLRARERERLAECVEERSTRADLDGHGLAVDHERDLGRARSAQHGTAR